MGKLPSISGREARKAFERAGWQFARQRGSHMVLIKPNVQVNLCIPDHRVLDTGLLRALVRDAGLTVDEFLSYL